MLAVGCSTEKGKQGSTGGNGASKGNQASTYSVGDTAKFKSYSVRVNSLYKTDGGGYPQSYQNRLQPNEVYVVVDTTLQSNTSAARQISFKKYAQVYDEGGYRLETSSLPGLSGPEGTLLPGRKLSGREVYIARKNASLTLVYNPKGQEGQPATFELGKVSDIPQKNLAPSSPNTSSATTSASFSPSSSQLAVGDTYTTPRGNQLTVLSYDSPIPAPQYERPNAGYEYSAIEVKACANSNLNGKVELNPVDFTLQMQDDTHVESDIDIKEPALPLVTLMPGDCVRGWVTFQTPEGQVPKYVIYDETFNPVKWSVENVETPTTSSSSAANTSTSSANPSEITAVENAVRGHYEAIGDGDFERAYSYFGPTMRSRESEENWAASEQSFDITSSTINSLDVTSVYGDTATATVDVSFHDKTGNPEFLITWSLVKENGQWKLDDQTSAQKVQ